MHFGKFMQSSWKIHFDIFELIRNQAQSKPIKI